MKTAAAYIRVSTDRQTELSPESQLNEIRAFAERNDIVLLEDHLYRDDGISGTSTKHRDDFMRMINNAKKKPRPFDAIIVWKFSRFARNREDSIVYKTLLKKNNVQVISVSEPLPDDDISSMTEAMIEAMDEYYSKRLSGEVRRGMKEKVSRGQPVSVAPIGYVIENGQYFPSNKAPFVRGIFEDFVAGMGYRNVAQKYGDLGLRTLRGNLPDNRFIEYILRNPVYIGKIRWCANGRGASRRDFDNENNMVVDSTHEPLITQELWNAAQKRIETIKKMYGKYQRPEAPTGYMLRGLVRCSACGATLIRLCSQYPSLQCHNYCRGTCKISHSISIHKVNQRVIEELKQAAKNKFFQLDPAAVRKANRNPIDYDKLIRNEQIKLERLADGYLSGAFTIDEFKVKKQQISETIQKLSAEADAEHQNNVSANKALIVKRIRTALGILQDPTTSEQQKNEALRSVVSKIIFHKQTQSLDIFYYI